MECADERRRLKRIIDIIRPDLDKSYLGSGRVVDVDDMKSKEMK